MSFLNKRPMGAAIKATSAKLKRYCSWCWISSISNQSFWGDTLIMSLNNNPAVVLYMWNQASRFIQVNLVSVSAQLRLPSAWLFELLLSIRDLDCIDFHPHINNQHSSASILYQITTLLCLLFQRPKELSSQHVSPSSSMLSRSTTCTTTWCWAYKIPIVLSMYQAERAALFCDYALVQPPSGALQGSYSSFICRSVSITHVSTCSSACMSLIEKWDKWGFETLRVKYLNNVRWVSQNLTASITSILAVVALPGVHQNVSRAGLEDQRRGWHRFRHYDDSAAVDRSLRGQQKEVHLQEMAMSYQGLLVLIHRSAELHQ